MSHTQKNTFVTIQSLQPLIAAVIRGSIFAGIAAGGAFFAGLAVADATLRDAAIAAGGAFFATLNLVVIVGAVDQANSTKTDAVPPVEE